MKCSKCGTEFEGKFCPDCGERTETSAIKCCKCNTEFIGNYCTNCGLSVEKIEKIYKKQKLALKIILIVILALIVCTFVFTLKTVSEDQFQTNLIAAACVGVKNSLKYPNTAEFNDSKGAYILSSKKLDDSYDVTGYVTFMNKDKITQRKIFKVNLKYEPKNEKPYQIINVKLE